jgi:beta-lactamase class D
MRRRLLGLILGLMALPTQAAEVERPDLARLFTQAGTAGTVVVHDLAHDTTVVVGAERAGQGFLPASTFKVVNALIALDRGVVSGPDEVLPWHGTQFWIKDCNADLALRSAFAKSCVPAFQDIARRIGYGAMVQSLARLDYGNGAPEPELADRFWLEGPFKISARQQVAFLKRLVTGQLPVSVRAEDMLREIMAVERTPAYTLYAKTGWADSTQPNIGWWIGWIDRADGNTVLFATNLDLTRPDLAKARQEVTRAVLRELGAL